MSGRRLRWVLRRWRLLFLLGFVFFWLRTVRDTHEPKTANQSNKYFHKFFHSGLLDLLVPLFIQLCTVGFWMPSLPHNALALALIAPVLQICRRADSNST